MAVATRKATKHATVERFLRSRREELVTRLQGHRDEVRAERIPDDSYGLASRTLLEDLTVDSLEREQQLLADIELALDRIEEGDYGVCEGCGADISSRRLQALPWARYCIECAERRQVFWRN